MYLRPVARAAGCWIASALVVGSAVGGDECRCSDTTRVAAPSTTTATQVAAAATIARAAVAKPAATMRAAVVSPLPLPDPPYGTEEAAAVAALRAVDVTLDDAMRAMRTLLGEEEGAELCESSAAQQVVLRALLWQSARLAGGFFVDNNGAHARLLQGPAGIGKSTMLRAFTRVCQALHHSVIPIYIDVSKLAELADGGKMDIMVVVADQLRRRGIAIAPDGDIFSPLSVRVTEALAATASARGGVPLRVLLLVDEIDELYRTPAGDVNALSCLGNLAYLGDRATGLWSVLLCGSNAATWDLITCNATEAMRAEFPLLYDAPNLNEQKYPVWLIPSPSSPIDSKR